MVSDARADRPPSALRLRRRAALGGLALAAVPLAGCAWNPLNKPPVTATYLNDIAGVAERLQGQAAEIGGVKVRDDATVEITLVEPRVYFPAKLTYPVAFVVDRANVASGAQWWTKPNGTGPFRVREAKPNESLVLARNDTFYAAKPALTEARFLPTSPLEAYEAG